MSDITRQLARFAVEAKWEDLPQSIVSETKRIIIEHLGTALAALTTDKGKMMAALGRRYGGPPESSIIGFGDRVSCINAALVNGELMITLDYHDNIAYGHDGTYVLPAILAIAETQKVSGKDLIISTALGLEISARLARAVGRFNITPQDVIRQRTAKRGLTGNAYSNFGAAAGAGRLLKLNEEKMLHALGVAGHLCMALTYARWGAGGYRYMAKYGVPGWQNTGALTAVLLAEMGYSGDTTVLDDADRGFRYFVGYPNWYPDEIAVDLGKVWTFNFRLNYKRYPCCGQFHAVMDCFEDVIEQNNLMPEEIAKVTIFGRGGMPEPGSPSSSAQLEEIPGIGAAQFSMPYNVSLLAHRITRGIEWIDPETMRDRSILAFMKKVSYKSDPEFLERAARELERDPVSSLSKVEVEARGRVFTVERLHRKGTTGTESPASDEDVIRKFKHNAERVLTKKKIEGAAMTLLHLDELDNVERLMEQITL